MKWGGCFEGFALEHGVVTALRHNEVFVPEKIDGFDEQQFMDKLESHIDKNLNNRNASFEDDEVWMMQLVNANPHLPICHEIMRFDNIHDKSLLLMIAFDYAQWADSDDEGLTLSSIDNIYPEDWECNGLRHELQNGTHILMKAGLIEQKCEDGIANTERYMLTQKAKTDLLSAYEPSRSKCRPRHNKDKSLTSFTEIKEKPLFYNPFEEDQIAQLTSLLSPENLSGIQHRLEEEGMRKGVACLFYGAPGTGKTETVLQIARRTGRNIMQIDIAGLRDKYVGESEKNIKSIFTRYKRLCKNSDILPILFFNEADGILTKRTSLTSSNPSIEKMENAIQNIILQEMENLEGILIATTNLTCNLDTAFERRFLFKIEFKKPETEVKAKIWKSMLRSISNEDAQILANYQHKYWSEYAPDSWVTHSEVMNCNGDRELAGELIEEYMEIHPEVVGLFGTNNGPTQAMASYIIDNERTDLTIMGFDYSDEMRTLVESETYSAATILQRQYQMGYSGVTSALDLINGHTMNVKYVDTGVVVVSHDTLLDEEVAEAIAQY